MKPNLYYKDDWCRLYNNDCIPIMRKIKENYVDLSFADPPYNVSKDYGDYDDNKPEDAYKNWCYDWLLELMRISKITLVTPSRGKMKMWMTHLPYPDDIIVWYKSNACTHSPFKVCKFITWEPIFVYGTTIGNAKPAHDLVECPISVQNDVGDHPCPKPRKLLLKLISAFTKPNDLVFDCFSGSGTTVLAAKTLQRRCISVETNSKFCEIIAGRLKQEVLPLEIEEKREITQKELLI